MSGQFIKKFRQENKELQNIQDRAKEILTHFCDDDLSGGVPIVEILIKLGFRIYQSDLEPEGMAAYIAVDPIFLEIYGSNKIACVNITNSIELKKFALAHELGHYLFDFDESKNTKYYDTYFPGRDEDRMEEKRANRFARELLMPKSEFGVEYQELQVLQSKKDIVDNLSRCFLVSNTEVIKRLNELEIEGFDVEEQWYGIWG